MAQEDLVELGSQTQETEREDEQKCSCRQQWPTTVAVKQRPGEETTGETNGSLGTANPRNLRTVVFL